MYKINTFINAHGDFGTEIAIRGHTKVSPGVCLVLQYIMSNTNGFFRSIMFLIGLFFSYYLSHYHGGSLMVWVPNVSSGLQFWMLIQVCLASGCERNWSTLDQIYTKNKIDWNKKNWIVCIHSL